MISHGMTMPRFVKLQCAAIGLVCLAFLWGCGEDDSVPAGPTPVPTATPTPLSSDLAAASNGGGCYPTGVTPALFDLLNLVNPEWAPVVNGMTADSEPVLVHGTAVYVH